MYIQLSFFPKFHFDTTTQESTIATLQNFNFFRILVDRRKRVDWNFLGF